MSKYNVGDKVRIVSERTSLMNHDGLMDKYLGAVMTIRAYSPFGSYFMEEDAGDNRGDGWAWDDETMFDELVEKASVAVGYSYETPAAFSWEAFKIGKIAVHCDTEDRAKAFLAECQAQGIVWRGGSSISPTKTEWDAYEEDTVYQVISGGFGFGKIGGVVEETDAIIIEYPFNTSEENRISLTDTTPVTSYKEVKRPAKIGDWVKITKAQFSFGIYKDGDILKVTGLWGKPELGNAVFLGRPIGAGYAAAYEYVVLEGYEPESTSPSDVATTTVESSALDKTRAYLEDGDGDFCGVIGEATYMTDLEDLALYIGDVVDVFDARMEKLGTEFVLAMDGDKAGVNGIYDAKEIEHGKAVMKPGEILGMFFSEQTFYVRKVRSYTDVKDGDRYGGEGGEGITAHINTARKKAA